MFMCIDSGVRICWVWWQREEWKDSGWKQKSSDWKSEDVSDVKKPVHTYSNDLLCTMVFWYWKTVHFWVHLWSGTKKKLYLKMNYLDRVFLREKRIPKVQCHMTTHQTELRKCGPWWILLPSISQEVDSACKINGM